MIREKGSILCEKELSLCSNCSRDWLTGLYSRAYIEEQLKNKVEKAVLHKSPLWFLMIDLDDFKAYNTQFGHKGGDDALRTVACVLRKNMRAEDIAARYAGDEFLLLISRTKEGDVLLLAERLRKQIHSLIFHGKQMSISIGIAACPNMGKTGEEVVGAADSALLKAKRRGKNQICIAQPKF